MSISSRQYAIVWHRWYVLLMLATIAVTTAGCVVQRNPLSGQRRAYGWTWEQEVQLGREADQQIVAQYGLYDDPQLTAYVNRVAQDVLANSHLRRPDAEQKFRETEFTFRVLDSPIVNAFALPGGFVYVTRGLLAHANNEAQLAVILGHEIGHVAGRHASRRAFQQQMGQLGLIGGAVLGQEVFGGQTAQAILELGGTAAQLLFLRYSRDDEREADQVGVEYAALSGYQTGEASEFFGSLRRIGEQHGAIPSFMATHPDPGEREQTMLRLAAEWSNRQTMSRVGEEQLLQAIQGMTVGEDPRQGFTRGNLFYHPDLRFQFPVPQGYQVINQPTQVVMVEPEQRAILGLTISPQSSLTAAASQFTQQQGIQVVEQGNTTSDGHPAYYVLADAQTEQGQAVRLLNFWLEHEGRIYNLIGYAERNTFPSFQTTFLNTMRNFSTLTDPQMLNVQPFKLDVRPAARTAAFSALIPSELPEGMTPTELAILNQVDLNETITQGQPIKIPVR